ncbi:MAG: 50S ribosomal protein L1, partial [Candidatus Altiarchaeota archaeon]|nr:50S ribosomal protein L1 [Candidatus Altiarchaeota archaeon]
MGRRDTMEKEAVIKKVKELLDAKGKKSFKQTVDLTINFTGIDVEDSKYKLNLNVVLPKGRGKKVEIGFFADGDMNVRAKEVSKHVYGKGELEELAKNRRKMRRIAKDCYAFIAQADLMTAIGKGWGIVLAPRGKMPQPVPPAADLKPIVERVRNSVRVKTKKAPLIHIP